MEKCKCVVIGDGSVGKTCMLISYTRNEFPAEYVPTVFDNYMVQIDVVDPDLPDIDMVELNLWDTAGQEDYDKLRPLSYDDTDIFVMCFSTVNETSFESIKTRWYPEVQSKISDKSGSLDCMIVGTKIDLREHPETAKAGKKLTPIPKERGEALAKEFGIAYRECSALTQEGLPDVFKEVIQIFLESKKRALIGKVVKVDDPKVGVKCCILM